MKSHAISDEQLLAYLEGRQDPVVEEALRKSAELQQRFNALREEESFLKAVYSGMQSIEPQDYVDMVTGQATQAKKLQIDAYLRKNPQARARLDALRKVAAETGIGRQRVQLPRIIALPLPVTAGLRGPGGEMQKREQAYYAELLQAQVTLRVAPLAREQYQLNGQVTQEKAVVPNARVTLRAEKAQPRPRFTDSQGFFEFSGLRPGVYRLQISLPNGVMIVSELAIGDE